MSGLVAIVDLEGAPVDPNLLGKLTDAQSTRPLARKYCTSGLLFSAATQCTAPSRRGIDDYHRGCLGETTRTQIAT